MSTCTAPFDSGPRLCRICQSTPGAPGLRRCSRLIAESPLMKALMLRAGPIAAADAAIMILGETGTGKEVLARALHANSPRRAKPFVAVNVAALPAELLESELFGHSRGAFTGAAGSKQGLFEAAHGGTLLLDEMGEMPLPLQAKLLRVLQDGEVRRVGETRAFGVDVRVMCATHQALQAHVAQGRFRQDLYYRLKVFTLTMPPLRDRKEDILPLARCFLEAEGRPEMAFGPAARQALLAHRWPGNIRELASAVTHAAVLSGGSTIDVSALPEDIVNPPAEALPRGALRSLADVEQEHVLRVLEACGGRQQDAARILGVGRTTLWRKLRAYGIDPER